MLIVSRKTNEKIVLAEKIEITVLEIGRNRVRFGIKAPKDVYIETRMKSPRPLETVSVVTAEPETPRKMTNVTPFPGIRNR